MTLQCWTIIDREVIARLRSSGWTVEKTKTQPIIHGVTMQLKARKGRWEVFAPDTAKLWDIASQLDRAGDSTTGPNRRYLATSQQPMFTGGFE